MLVSQSPEHRIGHLGFKLRTDQTPELYTKAAGAAVLLMLWHCQSSAGTRVGVCIRELRCQFAAVYVTCPRCLNGPP